MRATAVLVITAATLLLSAASATAGEAPKALSPAEANALARRAADGVDDTDALRRFQSSCRRRSALRFACTVRWQSGFARYSGTVTLRRDGSGPDYRDRFSTRITERETMCTRRCTTTHRTRGLFKIDTRRAMLGQALTLLGQEGELLRVTPEAVVDVPPPEYDEPRPGTRIVGVVPTAGYATPT
jgi:hypothetical protein